MSATDQGLSQAQIVKQIDASLKRLRVDHVDLYQCHRYDSGTPIEETMQALSDVVRQARPAIGFSEWSPTADRTGIGRCRHGTLRVEASRNTPCCGVSPRRKSCRSAPRKAYRRSSGRRWRRACCRASTRRAPSGRPIRGPAASSMGHSMDSGRRSHPRGRAKAEPLAREAWLGTLSQFALAWVLREPNVASARSAASRPQQLEEMRRFGTGRRPCSVPGRPRRSWPACSATLEAIEECDWQ